MISDGLKAEEQVVTTGFTRLSNGTRVPCSRATASRSRPRRERPRAGPAAAPEGRRKREGAENTDGKERRRRSENAPRRTPSAKQ